MVLHAQIFPGPFWSCTPYTVTKVGNIYLQSPSYICTQVPQAGHAAQTFNLADNDGVNALVFDISSAREIPWRAGWHTEAGEDLLLPWRAGLGGEVPAAFVASTAQSKLVRKSAATVTTRTGRHLSQNNIPNLPNTRPRTVTQQR